MTPALHSHETPSLSLERAVDGRPSNAKPRSNDGHDTRRLEDDTTTLARITNHCQGNAAYIYDFIEVVWALVLSQITTDDEVHFLSSRFDAALKACSSTTASHIRHCTMLLKAETSLSQLLDSTSSAFKREYANVQDDDRMHYGLSVRISADHNLCNEGTRGNIDALEARVFSGRDCVLIADVYTDRMSLSLQSWNNQISERDRSRISSLFPLTVDALLDPGTRTLATTDLCTDGHLSRIWSNSILESRERTESGVHELIQQQCRSRPYATAVSSWDGDLTYSELDSHATRIALDLRLSGVQSRNFVAICLTRSKWMAVALLGTLKAGAAFVYVDPTYPLQRLQYICQLVNAQVILCAPQHQTFAVNLVPLAIILSDADMRSPLTAASQETLPTAIDPADPVYTVFTSGSTGQPKGILMEHAAFCSCATAYGERLNLNHESRVLQISSCNFDVGIADYLATLIVGGCVCIPSNLDSYDSIAVVGQQMRVNWALLTPSMIRLLPLGSLAMFKTLAVIGESMRKSEIDAWSQQTRLICCYGPSECSILSTTHTCTSPENDLRNIGKPIAGVQCFVVNKYDHDFLVPVGAIGELMIRGNNLGRGYIGDVSKTQATFVENPKWLNRFPAMQGPLYKTGDLVQYTTDGNLSYLGRKDTQTKLRGQRVELGEIESRLSECWSQNVVDIVTREDGSEETRVLTAFIPYEKPNNQECVCNGPELIIRAPGMDFEAKIMQAQSYLSKLLPRYMIPGLFIPITRIPLTPTGKTDRRKLCTSAASMLADEVEQSAPVLPPQDHEGWDGLTKMQTLLLRLFAQTLHLPITAMNTTSNLFRLGCDSVSAIKFVGTAHSHNIRFSVADVFKHPSIGELSQIATQVESQAKPVPDLPPFCLLPLCEVDRCISLAAEQCSTEAANIEDIYPCTALQEGLFSLNARDRNSYVARYVYELPKDLDLQHYRQAWDRAVSVNSILRTRLILDSSKDHTLYQAVIKSPPEWGVATDVDEYLHSDAANAMALGGQLARLAIVDSQQASSRYFVFTIHHALFDAWSMPLLMETFESEFKGLKTPSRSRFTSFIKSIEDTDPAASRSFWQSMYDDFEFSTFPNVRAQYVPKSSQTLESTVNLADWTTSGCTLSAIIAYAWGLTQGSYTASDSVVFGLVLSGRNAPINDIESLACPTLATVPLRINLDRQAKLSQDLRSVNDRLISLIPFEQTGLDNISGYSRECAEACQFKTLLITNPERQEEPVHLCGRYCQDLSQNESAFTYPLTLTCFTTSEQVRVEMLYDPEALSDHTAKWLLDHFLHTIRRITEHIESPAKDLQSLSPNQLSQLAEWGVNVPIEIMECVHTQILTIAKVHPDKVAVHAWDGDLTYGQIDQMSAAVANTLTDLKLTGPDIFVPICLQKSKLTVPTILGVIRTGSAIVLLDHSYPTEVLQAICTDVDAKVVLGSTETKKTCSNLMESVLIVDDLNFTVPSSECIWPKSINVPESALYAVYTSGSTGKPKGIVIEHRAFATAAKAQIEFYGMGANTRSFQFASPAFDVGVSDNLLPLLSGGCICIPSEGDRNNDCLGAMNQLSANHIELTPSFARTLDPRDLKHLKTLVLGGEAMVQEDVHTWVNHVKLITTYGPAECSVTSTGKIVTSMTEDPRSIGFGLGCVCWIANPKDHNELAPIGAVGELIIEGPIVGREYLNKAAQSKAVFINAPAWLRAMRGSDTQLTRLYKTGDLAKLGGDGSLVFVGRSDCQIKLRGQRIELIQVETHLRRTLHNSRDMAVEVVLPADQREHMLAAFISCEPLTQSDCEDRPAVAAPTIAEPNQVFQALVTRAELEMQDILPSYMIPSIFVPLTSLPRTRTGKLDRRTLCEIVSATKLSALSGWDSPGKNKRAPSSRQEFTMQRLFSQVLEIDIGEFGADDHFFKLGGNSIKAMRLVALARSENVQLSVIDVFHHPILAELALLDVQAAANPSINTRIAPFSLLGRIAADRDELLETIASNYGIAKDGIEDVYPCTALQQGLMALSQKSPKAYTGRFVFRLPSSADIDRLRDAWRATVRANPILRTRIVQLPDVMLQVVTTAMTDVINVYDLKRYVEQDSLLEMRSGESMVRMAIVQAHAGSSITYCVLTQHHALYDEWSLSLILDQVEAAYQGTKLRQRDFNVFVKMNMDQDNLAAEKFWRGMLQDVSAVQFPMLPSSQGLYIPAVDKSTSFTITLNERADKTYTAAAAIQLAWALVQSLYTNSYDVVYGLTLSGRTSRPETAEITGPTFATVPLRVILDDQRTLAESVKDVQEKVLSMLQFEQTGLQTIARFSDDCSAACQFQTLLIVQPPQDLHTPIVLCDVEQDLHNEKGFNTYPLILICSPTNAAVDVRAYFDPHIIRPYWVERYLHSFGNILQQIYQNPLQKIGEVYQPSPADMSSLETWASDPPIYENTNVYDLIYEWVLSQPDAMAICAWDGFMTYAETHSVSSRIAQYLVKLGVGPDTMVPVYLGRSKWVPLAILAIIQARGTILFLDPSHPIQRLHDICAQAECELILTSHQLSRQNQSLMSGKSVVILDDTEQWTDQPATAWRPVRSTKSKGLYAVFTSGSTGTPKGVVVDDAAFCASMKKHSILMGFDSRTRAFQFASVAFDQIMLETLSAWANGGCSCVPSDSERDNALTMATKKYHANWIMLTPSLARALQPDDLPTISTLVLGGEAMSHIDTDRWIGKVTLITAYGPSECAAISAVRRWGHTKSTADPRNLGESTGCTFWITDKDRYDKLLPIGAVGEILIEGPILGRGYLADQQKTAATWVESPNWLRHFRNVVPERVYRTGDLARYDSDGTLLYLRRKDTQVKLRGQRIELQSIEAHLNDYFGNDRHVVVDVIQRARVETSALTAFVGPSTQVGYQTYGSDGDGRGLFGSRAPGLTEQVQGALAYLKPRLPRYMIPTLFLPLNYIPSTRTGKLDRSKLRQHAARLEDTDLESHAVKQDSGQPSSVKYSPRTEAEKTLQVLFARTLGLDAQHITKDSDFFVSGGDSIAAMKLVAMAQKEGWLLTVADTFATPKLSSLARSIRRLTATVSEKLDPFSFVKPHDGILRDMAARECGISSALINDLYPPTPNQEALLLATLKHPGMYINRMVFRLPRHIDLDLFERAWHAVVEQIPLLRARLVQVPTDGRVAPFSGRVLLAETDVKIELARSRGDMKTTSQTQHHSGIFLKFGRPLLSLALVEDEIAVHLVLTIHHVLYDGWSLPLIFERVKAAYTHQTIKGSNFGGFTKFVTDTDGSAMADFWRSQFDDLEAVHFPENNIVNYQPTSNQMLHHSAKLAVSARSNVTNATKVQLAWAVVQGRYTRSDDTIFGVTSSGRSTPIPDIEDIVGPTICTFPFRVNVERTQSIHEALRRVQDQNIAILPFQHWGLRNIGQAGGVASSACQFQTLLVMQTGRQDAPTDIFGTQVTDLNEAPFNHYPLTIECEIADDNVNVHSTFDPNVISRSQTQLLMKQFLHVLSQIHTDSDKKIERLSMTSETDRLLLSSWNPIVPAVSDLSVDKAISQHFERTPGAQAVSSWDGDMTYAHLEQSSTALAISLVNRCRSYEDVRKQKIVPLLFDKSKWVVVALLGVLRAGLAFVLLDPAHPVARLQNICQQIEAPYIISTSSHAEMAGALAVGVIILGDRRTDEYDCLSNGVEGSIGIPSASVQDLAYVVFTSGSTGNPKGILTSREACSTSAKHFAAALSLNKESRVLQFSSFAFDVSVSDILFTLYVGGCVCMPSEADRSNGLSRAITKMGCNWANLTPSVLQTLHPDSTGSLKTIIVGGETISSTCMALWVDRVHLIQLYGPAECGGIVTVKANMNKLSKTHGIGRPTSAVCWIVDEKDYELLAPVGAVGELLVQGYALANGYLDDEKAAQNFLSKRPLWMDSVQSVRSCSKYYRTGDLVRYTQQGDLLFVGRKDTQVKLRGQRVELSEVEHQLRLHNFHGLTEVVVDVVTWKLEQLERVALVAFIQFPEAESAGLFSSPNARFRMEVARIEHCLNASIPTYMIPSFFLPLAKIPLGSTGKIDRRRLIQEAATLPQTFLDQTHVDARQATKRPPSSPQEYLLRDHFAQVLGLEVASVGIDDNFFRLGGDSMTAMRLGQLARENDLVITVADIFIHKTVSKLASGLRQVEAPKSLNAFDLVARDDTPHEHIVNSIAKQCQLDPADVEDAYPCTALQQDFIALANKVDGSSVYTGQMVFKLPHGLDLSRFHQAWIQVIKANPILRTRIIQLSDQRMMQAIIARDAPWIERQHISPGATDIAINEYLAEDSTKKMNLGDPLLRLALIKETTGGAYFVLTILHAIYDDTSLSLILSQVEAQYNGVPPQSPGFNTFIRHIQNQDRNQTLSYWRSQFSGISMCTFPDAPCTTKDPKATGVARYTFKLETSHLSSSSPSSSYTASTKTRLAWAIVQSQYSGCQDVLFGVTVSGRNTPVVDIESITGPTIATVPIRIQLTSRHESTVTNTLEMVQRQSTEMIPFEQTGIREIGRCGDDAQAACRFRTLLVVNSAKSDRPTGIFGEECTNDYSSPTYGAYALVIICNLEQEYFALEANFDVDIVGEAEVRRLLQQLEHIYTQIDGASPDTLLRELNGIGSHDMCQIEDWNKDVIPPDLSCIHDLFQRMAMSQPESTAICAWDGSFTYRQLDEESSHLAVVLSKVGVKAEDLVPLLLEKSKWVGVAMLGVLKAGGAFVLIDTSYPVNRRSEIIDSLQPRVLITSSKSPECGMSIEHIVHLEDGWTVRDDNLESYIASRVTPKNAAYAVFTSGSTGRPKATVIEHASYCTGATRHIEAYNLGPRSRVLQFSSFLFDACIVEILSVILAGGCICMPSDHDKQNRLTEVINDFGVTWLQLTPSVAKLLRPFQLNSLETLVMMGEPISSTDIMSWTNQGIDLMTGYGPSECSICASVSRGSLSSKDARTIGFGTGANLWVVNQYDYEQLMPIGAIGELLIEGPIVGRGYRNDLERTRVAFLSGNPPSWLSKFRCGNSGRLYRTGDLVRYESDGSIKFIKRKDHQIKVRGQSLDMEDLEGHMSTLFQDATDVIVDCLTPRGSTSASLFAFIRPRPHRMDVDRPNADPDTKSSVLALPANDFLTEVKQAELQLHAALPSFMVPAFILPLSTVPLTATGKVDRQRLRQEVQNLSAAELEVYGGQASQNIVASESELLLQQIFADVLDVTDKSVIGPDSNFFRIGGDSILAMRLVQYARGANVHFNVSDVFKYPSISMLAPHITYGVESIGKVEAFSLFRRSHPGVARHEVIRIAAEQSDVAPEDIEDAYPCTSLQESLFALGSRQPNYVTQSVYNLPSNVDLEQLRRACLDTITANAILRTRIIQLPSNDLLQIVLKPSIIWLKGDRLEMYLSEDAALRMGVGDALIRFAIINEIGKPLRLVLTIHHAIYDAWSLPLAMDQIEAAYAGARLSSSDFSVFIAFLCNIEPTSSQKFWQTLFSDMTAAVFPPLPEKTYIPAATDLYTHTQSLKLEPDHENGDRTFTLPIMIQLAWAMTQSHQTSSDEILYGLTLSGRNAPIPGIEGIVGPTFTTVPIRSQLQPRASIKANLQSMQDQALGMMPFEQTGLHNVQRYLDEAGDANCQFQTQLIIQSARGSQGKRHLLGEADDYAVGPVTFSNFLLVLEFEVDRASTELTTQAHFDPQVLDRDQVYRYVETFAHFFQGLNHDIDRPLNALAPVSPLDMKDLMTWNAVLPERRNECVHHVVHQRTLETPDVKAVLAWDGNLSYAELDLLSDQVANQLLEAGAGPEVLIPLCFEKSLWVVVAMLAVLKTGAAIVPLDASYPDERIQEILEDTGAQIDLCSSRNRGRCGLGTRSIVVSQGSISTTSSNMPISRQSVGSDNAAYVVYTSGSSGKPKGIVLEHASLCTSMYENRSSLHIGQSSRILQFSSFAFDVSFYEIFGALTSGGCVCIPSEEQRVNDIENFISSYEVNWAWLTPSASRLIQPHKVKNLKTLAIGGEAVARDNVEVWASKVDLINGYGPAECTICVVGNIFNDWKTGTLGRACGGCSWIVNPSNLELLPIGAIGELLFEGPVIARQYLHDVEMTATAFVDAPEWLQDFRGRNTGPVYRTGDLVQYNSDGTLRFLGRKDGQVKIRGQRLELAEVESRIRRESHGLKEVVVELVKFEGRADDHPTLTAFVLCDSHHTQSTVNGHAQEASLSNGSGSLDHQQSYHGRQQSQQQELFISPTHPDYNDIRRESGRVALRLRSKLPRYMVPTFFIPLHYLPITKTDKLDRRRLRETVSKLAPDDLLQYTFAEWGASKRDPSSLTETILQELFSEVINMPLTKVGADDDFFSLGGDSIAAMRLAGLARQRGLHMTTADLFEQPQLSSLATKVSSAIGRPLNTNASVRAFSLLDESDHLERLRKMIGQGAGSIVDVLPMTKFQICMSQEKLRYFRFDLKGPLDTERMRESCRQLGRRHTILRTAFTRGSDRHLQIVYGTIDVPFQEIEDDHVSTNFIDTFCQADMDRAIIPDQPPTNFTLVRHGTAWHTLVMRMSHAQYDGISLQLLCEELTAFYTNVSPLPLSQSFSSYLYACAEQKNDGRFETWRVLLEGSSMTPVPMAMPLDGQDTGGPPRGIHILREMALPTPPPGITMASVVKVAWGRVLMQSLSRDDVVFGQLVSGRDSGSIAHADRVLGPCVNIVPVRVQASVSKNARDLLHQVQSQHARMLKHDFTAFAEIIKHATTWPDHTQFGSVVHHLGLSERISCRIGDLDCQTSGFFVPSASDEVAITSVSDPSKNTLRLSIDASDRLLSQISAASLIEQLCRAIEHLTGTAGTC